MARLNAAASPAQALESGYYVKPPAELSIAHELASRLELQPASTHLIVGGVGSGKTTEMLAACQRLAEDPEIAAIYVDVSEDLELDLFSSGTFLAALIHGLAAHLDRHRGPAAVEAAMRYYEDWATLIESHEEHDIDVYQDLVSGFTSVGRTPVLFMDSLDRLTDPQKLEAALKTYANVVRTSGMGLVLTGSVRLRHGLDRSLRDFFDQLYNNPYVDTNAKRGLDFLGAVLRARAPVSLIPQDCAIRLARLSGGVLRDLLTLAQAAVNETYIRGGEQVTTTHIEIAADGFGRKQLLGLDSDEIATLQRVRTKGTFVQTSNKDLALLLTRHVLEHQDANGKTIYSVHPTLEPLLAQIAGAA
jgi:hypothetical protein